MCQLISGHSSWGLHFPSVGLGGFWSLCHDHCHTESRVYSKAKQGYQFRKYRTHALICAPCFCVMVYLIARPEKMAENCITSKRKWRRVGNRKILGILCTDQNLRGRGDSAAEVLAMQAQEPEFESLEPVRKAGVMTRPSPHAVEGCRDRQNPGAQCQERQTEKVSLGFQERLRTPDTDLWPPCVHGRAPTHPHENAHG